MSNYLSRAHGMKQGRLPGYIDTYNEVASKVEGAKRFRISMSNLAIQNAEKRLNGDIASFKTIDASKDALGGFATTLWGLGYQLNTPEGITEKHIRAIIRHKWAYGISVGAFSVLLTQLVKLAIWIKKPGLLRDKTYYLPEVSPEIFKRKYVAGHSKSVIGNGFDLETVIKNADSIDKRFGAMVRMEIAFGLRRCEVLKIIPHLDDRVVYFDIRKGVAKNGRERQIPVETESQRNTLIYVKSLVGKKEHLGWLDKPKGKAETSTNLLKRNEGRYNNFMRQLGFTKKHAGVTGHGLRAQYAEDMALTKGFVPATLGGTTGQFEKEDLDIKRMQIAESMGHSRVSVTGAYYGKLTSKIPNSHGQRLGLIQIGSEKLATLFINPPLIPQVNGCYIKVTPRKLESMDVTALIEDVSTGLGIEVAKIDLKLMESSHQLTIEENDALLRLSVEFLRNFGVHLNRTEL